MTSPYGNAVHHQENVTHGQFAFTTSEDGSYMACFSTESSHDGGKAVTAGIEWKTGIAAKDWESVAKKEHVEVSSSSTLLVLSLTCPLNTLPFPFPFPLSDTPCSHYSILCLYVSVCVHIHICTDLYVLICLFVNGFRVLSLS